MKTDTISIVRIEEIDTLTLTLILKVREINLMREVKRNTERKALPVTNIMRETIKEKVAEKRGELVKTKIMERVSTKIEKKVREAKMMVTTKTKEEVEKRNAGTGTGKAGIVTVTTTTREVNIDIGINIENAKRMMTVIKTMREVMKELMKPNRKTVTEIIRRMMKANDERSAELTKTKIRGVVSIDIENTDEETVMMVMTTTLESKAKTKNTESNEPS